MGKETLQRKVEALELQIATLEQKIATLETEKEILSETVASLKSQLKSKTKEVQELQQKNEELIARLKQGKRKTKVALSTDKLNVSGAEAIILALGKK